MGAMINKLVGANADANADADTNDWVTTLALLDFVRRAKNGVYNRGVSIGILSCQIKTLIIV